MTQKKLTEKNTKTELLSGYEALLETVGHLQAEQKTMQTENQKLSRQLAQAQTAAPVQAAKQAPAPAAAPAAAPALPGIRDTDTLRALELVQQNLGATASQLSEWLTQETEALLDIQGQVSTERADLKALHGLEVTPGLLGQLIENHEGQARQFQDELDTRRQEMQAQARAAREAWSQERQTRQQALEEQDERFEQEFSRQAEEYRYGLELTRQLDAERHEQEMTAQRQALQDRRDAAARTLAEREQALAEREREAADIQARAAVLEQEKETALKKARDEGRGIASGTARQRADIQSKDIEGQRQAYELRIEALNVNVSDQQARIQTLTAQLESASRQVQDLAVKAIEGAAGANASQVLREIALEQAKQTKKY